MPIKDRTNDLRKKVNEEDDNLETSLLLENNDNYMNDFFNEIQAVRDILNKLENYVAEVKTLHSSILSSPQQDKALQDHLEKVMDDIKINAKKVQHKLKDLSDTLEQDCCSRTSADYRIKFTQSTTLSCRFKEIMCDYNNCQVDFRQLCKERIQRQFEIADKSVTDDELESMIVSGNPGIFTQEILIDSQQAKQSLQEIEARHEDIMKLEKSIKELHDMFIDMALLLSKQGDLIDSIQYNVAQAKDFVDEGRANFERARRIQRSYNKKKMIVIGIVSFIVLIVILSVVLSLYSK